MLPSPLPVWDITHSPKHWSNESTMIQYMNKIIVPYIKRTLESFDDDMPALVILHWAGHKLTNRSLGVHVCLLPPNTTDLLQPMDLSVNKPAKDFLRR